MRMRWRVALAALGTASVALAGLAVASGGGETAARAAGAPWVLPTDLSWRLSQSCTGDPDHTEACLARFRIDTSRTAFDYVNVYERAQLYDYYTGSTVPCLARHGVVAPVIARSAFFDPAKRPWNVYTDMAEVAFDRIIDLYRACPPVPQYLLARHGR
ncbi:MAG: hypothetical protein ACTHKX_08745 [Pseudolysinimonas sp.]